ncbi:HAD family hydrolase [Segetibacter koreensis]|uniref:HAD family hydrolase n=1 Tax=Segetibacter koreensis TaxID=398037 RepID=UPI000372EE99|nr:HAD family hydrolase [Segetibacter koreensis]
MSKKAIIFDLDNTIYSVHSIGDKLFATLFQLIIESGKHDNDIDAIKDDIMRKPFQVVAAHYSFSDELTQKGIDLLKNLTYRGPIKPFSDYQEVKHLPAEKFLVTTGFLKLQQSKIERMGIEKDFKEIHIVDPATSGKTKKDVFADVLKRNKYNFSEVLVVGDDPHSEIKAAKELGIEAVLYDKNNYQPATTSVKKIVDFKELRVFF